MTLVAVGLFLFFTTMVPGFFGSGNLSDVAASYSFVAICAMGMTFLLVVGELDLSVGANYGLAQVEAAWLTTHGISLTYALVITLATSTLVGLINALVTLVGKVPSFIVTVGMLSVLEGLSLYISGGFSIPIPNNENSAFLHSVAGGYWGAIQAPTFWVLGCLAVFGCVLAYTKFGYHVYLTGGNRVAARQIGISVGKVKTACFVITGALAGLSGCLSVSWLGSAQSATGFGDFLLTVIAATIIGGVDLEGGAGSIYGAVVGSAILAILVNGLSLYNVNPAVTTLLTGALIIGAGALGVFLRRRHGDTRRGSAALSWILRWRQFGSARGGSRGVDGDLQM